MSHHKLPETRRADWRKPSDSSVLKSRFLRAEFSRGAATEGSRGFQPR